MRGINNRQTTIQRMRMIRKMRRPFHKGGKRVPISRRPPGK